MRRKVRNTGLICQCRLVHILEDDEDETGLLDASASAPSVSKTAFALDLDKNAMCDRVSHVV